MKFNFAGSVSVKDEIRAAIRKIKSGNSAGTDSLHVSMKLLEALEDCGIDTHNINQ